MYVIKTHTRAHRTRIDVTRCHSIVVRICHKTVLNFFERLHIVNNKELVGQLLNKLTRQSKRGGFSN